MSTSFGVSFPRSINQGHLHFRSDLGVYFRYIGGDPSNPLNWVIAGGAIEGDPDTTGWGTAQDGAWWFNRVSNTVRYWDGSAIQTIGTGGGVGRSFDPFNMSYDWDDFISGNISGGNIIGKWGWNINTFGVGSGIVFDTPVVNHPGLVTMTTGAGIGNHVGLFPYVSNVGRTCFGTETFDSVSIVNPVTSDINTRIRVGMLENESAVNDAAYFEKDFADVNWFFVTGLSGVYTRVDSGVPIVPGTFYRLRVRRLSGTAIGFSINGGSEASLVTNLPASIISPMFVLDNDAAADKRMMVDYCDLLVSGLTR